MIDLLLISLAAWRLASLLVDENGPGAMFARLRYRAGIRGVVTRDPVDGRPVGSRTARGPLAEGLTCVWCVSVWTAGGLVLAGWLLGLAGLSGLYEGGRLALAGSAGAIVIAEILRERRGDAGTRGQ